MEQNNQIIAEAKAFVEQLLHTELADSMHYHNLEHTIGMWQSAKELSNMEGLNPKEKEWVEIAALFHDVGFTKTYLGHEEASQEIAKSFLLGKNYPGDEIAKVGELIQSTEMGRAKEGVMQQILGDADLSHISSKAYFKKKDALREEWKLNNYKILTDEDWKNLNIIFFESHEFLTDAANALYLPGKKKNYKKLKGGGKIKKPSSSLNKSKPAQMMFKTALRNHIDLTGLADNKANIMLSINAIIITISLPYLPGYIQENPGILVPAGILIATCLSSIIAATMATRPIPMKGLSDLERVKNGSTSLFFFGNFYKMSARDYQDALSEVIANEDVLEKTVLMDLYYLGKSLGKKYHLLRVCYTIFMVGIALTVISMVIMNLINH
ncbi:MAG: HD domain-containing protein [Saprospiraceae bacterium]|nr:HD domain-containing protein [Saprospiraceae bacterium]